MRFCPKLVVVILFLKFLSLSLEYLLKTNGLFLKRQWDITSSSSENSWNEYILTVIVSKTKNASSPLKILNQISYQRFNRAVFIMHDTVMLSQYLYLRTNQYRIIDHSTMHLI